MKEEKKALLHGYTTADRLGIQFPNLEKHKVKDADSDLASSFKNALSEAKLMRKALMKKLWFLYTPAMIISTLLMLAGAILNDETSNSLYISLIVCGAILFFLFAIISMRYIRKINANEEYTLKLNKIQSLRDSIELSLGAPMDINKIDIIYPASKLKKNGEKGFFSTLKTYEFRIFKKDGNVCVIANNSLYILEGCEIKSFKINPKQVSFNKWNKKEGYSSPKYKPYKIGYYSKSNTYFVKNTGELRLSIDGDDYYATVLPWSVPDLEQILKITATLPEKNKKEN